MGSRVKHTHSPDEYWNIAIQYAEKKREDDVFAALNSEPLTLEEIRVEHIPFSKRKLTYKRKSPKRAFLF
jgi:hypothetical protein